MGTDISGIAKNVLQSGSNVKLNTSVGKNKKDTAVSFMELMNQNSFQTGRDVVTDSAKMDLIADTSNTTKTAYDTSAGTSNCISVKKKVTPEEMRDEASESFESYEEKIRKVLKEELDVTEEQISAAMENLGMSFLDLQNFQNLSTLIQTLTNEDIGTLFLSDAFQSIMEQVTDLTDDLCLDLGITREELDMLSEAWKQTDSIMSEASAIPEMETISEMAELEEAITALKEDTKEMPEVSDTLTEQSTEPVKTVISQQEEQQEQTVIKTDIEDTDSGAEQTERLKQSKEDMQEESKKESGEQNLFEHSKDAKTDTSNSGLTLTGHQAVTSEEFAITQESTQSHTTQVDVNNIIQQIARNVRVTVSAAATSMEMQLNPEHLGKLYLNISEREGIIRAQITAQNENVKEALETQLVELRESLNQQGVKVDAIEVTVAAHEFEQNLEENAKQDEQMQQQMEESKKQARRNLNLNELDELSGLMTEEEQLAAQIMRDNGNQVDLTA